MEDYFGTILGMMGIAVTALSGAVTALWSRAESRAAKNVQLLDKCEEERLILTGNINRLEQRVASLEEKLGLQNDRTDSA